MKKQLFHLLLGSLGLILLLKPAYTAQPPSSPAEVVESHSPKQLIGVASKIAATATTPRDYSEMIYYLDKESGLEQSYPNIGSMHASSRVGHTIDWESILLLKAKRRQHSRSLKLQSN